MSFGVSKENFWSSYVWTSIKTLVRTIFFLSLVVADSEMNPGEMIIPLLILIYTSIVQGFSFMSLNSASFYVGNVQYTHNLLKSFFDKDTDSSSTVDQEIKEVMPILEKTRINFYISSTGTTIIYLACLFFLIFVE